MSKFILEERAERVAQLAKQYQRRHKMLRQKAENDAKNSSTVKKNKNISLEYLWNVGDYQQYVSSLTDYRHVQDLYRYLSLCQEISSSAGRTRQFDRDYYCICVMEGMQDVCYQFTLVPYHVGIQLEENMALANEFRFDRILPGEDEISDPRRWSPPTLSNKDPQTFASDLIDSEKLVLFNNNNNPNINNSLDDMDHLVKGCRYVAAMELAYEPRPMEHREAQERKSGLSLEERKELDKELFLVKVIVAFNTCKY